MTRGRKKKPTPIVVAPPLQQHIYLIEDRLDSLLTAEQMLEDGVAVYHPQSVPRDRKDYMIHTLAKPFPPHHTNDMHWVRLLGAWYHDRHPDPLADRLNGVMMAIVAELVPHQGFKPSKQRSAIMPYVTFWQAARECVANCPELMATGFDPMQVVAQLMIEGGLVPMGDQAITTKKALMKQFSRQNHSLDSGANPFFNSVSPIAWQFAESCRHHALEDEDYYRNSWLPMVAARKALATHIQETGKSLKTSQNGYVINEQRRNRNKKISEKNRSKPVENLNN